MCRWRPACSAARSIDGKDDAIRLDQGMRLAGLLQLQAPCRLGGDHRDDLDPFYDPQGNFGVDRAGWPGEAPWHGRFQPRAELPRR